MKKILLFLSTVLLITLSQTSIEAATFTDDFESGNLDNWTIGGRQAEGSQIANVISYNGSLSGHLYKYSFTEITIFKDFQYNALTDNDLFSFDLSVDVYPNVLKNVEKVLSF